MKWFLIVTGVGTLVLLAAPSLVVIGLYALILPGLIMGVMPTVFGYTALFAFARTRLALAEGWRRNVAATGLVFGIGCLLAAPWSMVEESAFRVESEIPQVLPSTAVPLAGNVKLVRDRLAKIEASDDRWIPACDALCATLLDTPGVTSVELAQHDGEVPPLRYALVPKTQVSAKSLQPLRPEEILGHRLESPAPPSGGNALENARSRQDESKAVAAHWALRLAGSESLAILDAVTAPDMTISIRDPRMETDSVTVAEVEIRQREETLLRYRRVSGKPLFVPLVLMPNGTSDMRVHWEWGRRDLYAAPESDERDPIRVLYLHTTLAVPDISAQASEPLATEMAKQIAAALADPARSTDHGAFSLVPQWLKSRVWNDLAPADTELIAALIIDDRIQELRELYDGAARDVSPALRAPISFRLRLPGNSPGLLRKLDELVHHMPPGTYARLLPDEEAILADPLLWRAAPALAMRLADSGSAAVPRLTTLLAEEARHPKRHQSRALERLCQAFTRLGPAAAAALPLVEELFSRRSSPIINTSDDADEWRVAMVRMGKAIEDVPFPADMKPERLARDREDLARRVERATKEAEGGGDG